MAVVTGASRGLGAGIAAVLAGEGLRLGLCARSTPPLPDGADPTAVVTAAVDVTDAAAVDTFVDEVLGRFGRIDLWVNNAGLLEPVGPLAEADPALLQRNVDVNVTGVLFGSRAFARHVRARSGQGVLVNLSSGAATSPYRGWAAYCAAKAAVDMVTAVVADEERDHGLVAYALAPGVVDTDMQALVRASSAAAFPAVERFRRLHREGAINSPAWVGRFVLDLARGRVETTGVRVRAPEEPAPSTAPPAPPPTPPSGTSGRG